MKILIIHCGYPLNESAGEGVRTMNMAKSLSNLGHSVVVLMLYSILNFKVKNLKFINYDEGVKQIHIPTFPTSRLLKLALLYNSFIVWMVVKFLSIKAIQAEVTWSASVTRFVKNIPLVTDFHSDLVPELTSTNRSPSFIDKSVDDNYYALQNSYRILCVSKTLHDNLSKTYQSIFPYNILPCNVDFKTFTRERMKPREELRKKYGLKDKIILSYLGGTHPWQCLDETFDIFFKLRSLDTRYYFCLFTNGNLDAYAFKIEKIKDSFMTMSLAKNNIVEHLSMIDVGFVIRDNLLLNANSSPTKIGEYMAVGAMVVATKYAGDAPVLIKESGYGFVLESKDPSVEEIEKLSDSILAYKDKYDSNSLKVRDYIEYARDWQRNEDKLDDIYRSIDPD